MTERDNEHGIQAERPVSGDTRIQSEPPLHEPLRPAKPSNSTSGGKWFSDDHPLVIILASCLLGTVMNYLWAWSGVSVSKLRGIDQAGNPARYFDIRGGLMPVPEYWVG